MAYDFSSFKASMHEVHGWLQDEYTRIRTGRATPTLLDSVRVPAYGAHSPINQIASVLTEDARTLHVSVWDTSLVPQVERAILDADLGVSVISDGKGLRVVFPELSGERRIQLTKLAKEKLEEARVSVRQKRDDENKEIAEIASEDERFAAKEQLQKIVEEQNTALAALFDTKEAEIQQ